MNTINDTMPDTQTKALAWHFLTEDRRLGNGDGRLVVVGETLESADQPVLCQSGMHASARAMDALIYAPGPVVCRVVLLGDVVFGNDKLVATHRSCIAMDDASDLLHEFSCWCAESALTHWEKRNKKKADKRSWYAIKTKRQWLSGKASDEELYSAWAAARAAARAAAWAAARAAVWNADRNADWAAVLAADRAAFWAADWAAARNAVLAAARAAVWAAARNADRNAEIESQNKELESRLIGLLGLEGVST